MAFLKVSVLGSYCFFFIYFNDLNNCLVICSLSTSEVSKVKTILLSLADNTHYTAAARTEKRLLNLLKSGMLYIEKWMRLNKLKLNHKKSSLVIYGWSSNYYPWYEQIQLSGNIILRDKSGKFPGAECVSFKNHVRHISAKITHSIVIIKTKLSILSRILS